MVGGTKFYSHKRIRDVISYLNLVANPADNISFERVINEPKRGVGPGTLEKIRTFAYEQNMSLLSGSAVILSPIEGKLGSKFSNMILELHVTS